MSDPYLRTVRIKIPTDKAKTIRILEQQKAVPQAPGRPRPGVKLKPGTSEYALYREFMQITYDAVIVTNLSGYIADANIRARKFLQYKEEELCGLTLSEIVSGMDQTIINTVCRNLDENRFTLIEACCMRKDQSLFFAEIAANKLHLGKEEHLCFFIRDMTRRKQAEEAAQLRQRQLIQADKMRSLGILVAGVAHEINNPNGLIVLNTPILKEALQDSISILDAHWKQNGDFDLGGFPYSRMRTQLFFHLDEIIQSATRINRIVEDLKEFSRPREPDFSEHFDLNRVVQSAVRLMESAIRKATHHFTAEYAPHIPSIYGNSQRIEQVVVNLVLNACQAMTDLHKSIRVTTRVHPDEPKAFVEVRDEGMGIPEEYLDHLAEPFFTTRRDKGGTGLGLAISSDIVKEHGGLLRFKSAVGAGTTVTLEIPTGMAPNP